MYLSCHGIKISVFLSLTALPGCSLNAKPLYFGFLSSEFGQQLVDVLVGCFSVVLAVGA